MQDELNRLTTLLEETVRLNDEHIQVINELKQELNQSKGDRSEAVNKQIASEKYIKELQAERLRLEEEVHDLEKSLAYDYDYERGQRQVSSTSIRTKTIFNIIFKKSII